MDLPPEVSGVARSQARAHFAGLAVARRPDLCPMSWLGTGNKKAVAFATAFRINSYRLLFAEQSFDIQSLRLQNFTQTTQTFNLDLTNTFAGKTDFPAYILQRCRFIA